MIRQSDPAARNLGRRAAHSLIRIATGAHTRFHRLTGRRLDDLLYPIRLRGLRLSLNLKDELARITQVATSPWLIGLAAAAAACLLLWILGPLLSLYGFRPLESETLRLFGVLIIMAAWSLLTQARQLRDRQGNRRLVTALTLTREDRGTDDPLATHRRATLHHALALARRRPLPDDILPEAEPASNPEETARTNEADEVADLRRSLSTALDAYGRRRGRRWLRRLPWYLVIGAPGTGKTSALSNAGLTFPLGDILGHRPLQGVAETRTCDWWFTADAVLIDTAGRYTTHDRDPSADADAWRGLLALLKQHRPLQPINGVVLTISLDDIADPDEVGRRMIASALERRLSEIDQHLGIRLPVYVLLTKIDRLAGFAEFFADLDAEQRRQVWGMTFPWTGTPQPGAVGGDASLPWSALVGRHFDGLTARLEQRLFERLNHEPDPARRALIAGFPQQVASLRTALIEFLALAVRSPDGGGRFGLRGVYLSSARREGIPLDRLGAGLAAAFGIAAPLPTAPPLPGPPFFLARLFQDLVFTEAHLAEPVGGGLPPTRQLRRRWGAIALAAIMVIVCGIWGRAWLITHQALNNIDGDLRQAAASLTDDLGGGRIADAVGTRLGDGDATAVLATLAPLRTLAGEHTHPVLGASGSFAGGFDPGGRLARLGGDLYQRALRRLLLPRLVIHLEDAMGRTPRTLEALTPDRLYDALKVYLMLDGEAPLDRYTVTRWFTIDWMSILPGPEHEPERRQLADHLSALLDAGLSPIPGSVLVEDEARRRLAAYPVADRGYALVRSLPAVRALPGWHPVEHVGATLAQVLVRGPAHTLSEPMPGLYTASGARQVVIPAIGRAAAELAQEGWVLGLPMDPVAVAERARRLRQAIGTGYFSDYARQWQDLLGELSIVPTGDLPHLLKAMALAGGPASPLPTLIAAMIAETRLPPPLPTTATAAGKKPSTAASPGVGSTVVTAVRMITGEEDPGWWGPAANDLATRLQPLYTATQPGAGRNPPPLTAALAALAELHHALERWAAAPPAAKPQTRAPFSRRDAQADVRRATDRVRAAAAALPPPIAAWFAGFAEAAGRALLVGTEAPP